VRYRHVRHRYEVMLATGSTLAWRAAELAVVFAPPRWRPNVDVWETSGAVSVTVELAGVDPDDVDILLYENALVVQGERAMASCEEDRVYHEVEIRRGPFRLELPLPMAVEPTAVEARQEQGLLRITLPKAGG
jgi:HSP20 family protein